MLKVQVLGWRGVGQVVLVIAAAPRTLLGQAAKTLRHEVADVVAGLHEMDVHVVLDAAECALMDAGALGQLVGLHRDLHRIGARFTITGLSDDLRTLFALTKLDTVIATRPRGVLPWQRAQREGACRLPA